MLIYETTCRSLQEGFQYEMLKLENLQDTKKIEEIRENTLAILRKIEEEGGEQVQDRVASLERYIRALSKKAIKEGPIRAVGSSGIEFIPDDGHCFFRAAGYGLYELCKSNPHFLEGLKQRRDSLLQVSPKSGDVRFAKTLAEDLTKLIDVLPKARARSRELIEALRNLSCTWNEEFHRERAEGDPDLYFRHMRTGSDKNAWGGGPEIDALMEVLGIQICTSEDEAAICGYDNSRPIITLQHTGNHFNLFKRVDQVARGNLPSLELPGRVPLLQSTTAIEVS